MSTDCNAEYADCTARELARCLASIPSVVAVDRVGSALTPSGRVEIEAIVETTARGTVPNSVTHAVVRSSLGIAPGATQPGNAPGTARVVIR